MTGIIKTLMFDLGGVITDIDGQRCINALTELGMKDAGQMIGAYVQRGDFQEMETGRIGADEFISRMLTHLPDDTTGEQVAAAIQKFIIGIPKHRLAALRQLKKRYRLTVLSNTNPIMIEGVIGDAFKQEGLCMADYFDGMTLSYKACCTKPDRAIFEWAERHMRVVPAETLFLDDSQTNIDAARSHGFHAALVPPGAEFMQLLTEMNLT